MAMPSGSPESEGISS